MITAVVLGDIAQQMREEYLAGKKAVKAAIMDAGKGLQADWRGQIIAAGLGQRLPRTIRVRAYPPGRPSMNAAALVYTQAPEIISAFDSGVVIRSKVGFWLAIPTEAAGKKGIGGVAVTPANWEQRHGLKLRMVYRRGRSALLVADGARINSKGRAVMSRSKTGKGQVTAVIFILVPQVNLRKRLDLSRDAAKWHARIPDMIVQNWPEV